MLQALGCVRRVQDIPSTPTGRAFPWRTGHWGERLQVGDSWEARFCSRDSHPPASLGPTSSICNPQITSDRIWGVRGSPRILPSSGLLQLRCERACLGDPRAALGPGVGQKGCEKVHPFCTSLTRCRWGVGGEPMLGGKGGSHNRTPLTGSQVS